MPFVGLGLHILVALYFGVHAMRHGRPMYWLFVLFSFPLLGSIVYFFVEYLPASRLECAAGRLTRSAIGFLDPDREHREALAAYDLAPTAQNKIRLARAALNKGQATEAAGHYRDALTGPWASDPELQFGLASALVTAGSAPEAAEALQARDPGYRADEVALLNARALAQAGRSQEARQAFHQAVATHNTVEARARYIVWLAQQGDSAGAAQQWAELQQGARHWNAHARGINQPWMRLAEDAMKG